MSAFLRIKHLSRVEEESGHRSIYNYGLCTTELDSDEGDAGCRDQEIEKDPDTKMTYLGYRRFLESDLKHIFPVGNGRTANAYRRDVRYLAKQMLIRGYVSNISYISSPGL